MKRRFVELSSLLLRTAALALSVSGVWALLSSAGHLGVWAAEVSAAGSAGTPVCGRISGSVRWTVANSPYLVTCNSEVVTGGVLTIDPGVAVRFSASTALAVKGGLHAVGTPDQLITFTSASSTPAPGDWAWLWFVTGHTSSRLEHVVVEYSGQRGSSVFLQDGFLTLLDSTIRFSADVGLRTEVMPTLLDSRFENNGGPAVTLYLHEEDTGSGSIVGNSGTGNGTNGIAVSGSLFADATLGANAGLPYYTTDSGLRVGANHTLTLLAGAVFKMAGTKFIVNGSIEALGQPEAPVVFTSLRDDAYGGDTNGDGDSTQPSPADWRGMMFNPPGGSWPPPFRAYLPFVGRGAVARGAGPAQPVQPLAEGREVEPPGSPPTLYFDHVVLRYGGVDQANLEAFSGRVQIFNSTIDYSARKGLYVQDTSAEIRDTTLADNADAGLWIYGNTQILAPVLVGNLFRDNGTFAAYLILNRGCHPLTEIHGNTGWGNGKVNGIYMEGYVHTSAGCQLGPNAQLPYVLWTIWVSEGAHLTLDPGVHLKFVDPDLSRGSGTLIVSGTLEAVGTTEEPVVFTSFWDDETGGDTDGTPAPPARGDWIGLLVRPGGEAAFDHAVFRYGGSQNYNLSVVDGDLALTNSHLSYSANVGLGVEMVSNPHEIDFENNTFAGNGGYAVVIRSEAPEPIVFGSSDNEGSGNGINGILVGAPVGTMTFKVNPSLPYIIQGITVSPGETVTVEPGVVFKGDQEASGGGSLLTVDGALNLEGTAEDPVHLTSLHDDSVGGDTLGDGNAVSPAWDDWRGINVGQGGNLSLVWSVVRYAGSDGAAIFSDGGQVTAEHCDIRDNKQDGCLNMPLGNLTVTHSVIRHNGASGINNGGSASVRFSDIAGNGTYGVYSWAEGVIINAEQNYWGAANGPSWDGIYCAAPPQGSGDQVSCNSVDWWPFAGFPYH